MTYCDFYVRIQWIDWEKISSPSEDIYKRVHFTREEWINQGGE